MATRALQPVLPIRFPPPPSHLVPSMSTRALQPMLPIRFPLMFSSVMRGRPAMQLTSAATPSSGMLLCGSLTVVIIEFI